MRYLVEHVSHYDYGAAVSGCRSIVRLTPRELPHQHVLHHELRIAPLQERTEPRVDYFGNTVVSFAVLEPHDTLVITAESELLVERAPPPARTPPWEQVRDAVRVPSTPELLRACELTIDSAYAPATPEARDYAAASFLPGRPLGEALLELNRRVHQDFRYEKGATSIDTTVDEVFHKRRGVCQDFAHVMIACLRSHGLPARYVSGYLETAPPEGSAALVGNAASHAWVSTFAPEWGWLDVDPTNDAVVADHHVTLAWGRDYGDVSPVMGVTRGGAQHTVEVSVSVARQPDGGSTDGKVSGER